MPFSDGIADFRSDTVTRPTVEMFEAMSRARVGDDVYVEDPEVNELQESVAGLVGKEAALFVPSGSMGNQLALSAQTRPGDSVLCVPKAHIRIYELGAAEALSGVNFALVDSDSGHMEPDAVRAAVNAPGYYDDTKVALVAWENTHNTSGGTVLDFDAFTRATAAAREAGCAVHLDGARIWNAVTASGITAAAWCEHVSTVMFCFSKGLGAPIGSIIAGDQAVIDRARIVRKRLGGGMRQVGVLAAAARVALDHRHKLDADHALARRLGEALAERHPGSMDLTTVQTNMVRVEASRLPVDAATIVSHLNDRGVKVGMIGTDAIRFVTHRDVDDGDVDRLLKALDEVTS